MSTAATQSHDCGCIIWDTTTLENDEAITPSIGFHIRNDRLLDNDKTEAMFQFAGFASKTWIEAKANECLECPEGVKSLSTGGGGAGGNHESQETSRRCRD